MTRMLHEDRGFTLLELMVVVLIIGILVAVAVPVFLSITVTARRRACWSNERIVEGAYQTYLSGDGPPATDEASLQALLQAQFLMDWPICPNGGTYTATFESQSPVVRLTCSLHGHF